MTTDRTLGKEEMKILSKHLGFPLANILVITFLVSAIDSLSSVLAFSKEGLVEMNQILANLVLPTFGISGFLLWIPIEVFTVTLFSWLAYYVILRITSDAVLSRIPPYVVVAVMVLPPIGNLHLWIQP